MWPSRLLAWAAAALVCDVTAKVGFIKDQAMDAVFPGPVYSQAPSLPVGHMRPLGWQRKTDGPILEAEVMPATQEFWERYLSRKKPAVFRNAITEAPAFQTWQEDNYLKERYGHLNVTVTVKVARRKDTVVTSSQSMKLKRFLFDYMYEEWYLASVIPRDMMKELPLPLCVRCGTVSDHLVSAQLWMSSGGTSSRVHSHDDHLLHCVLFGRRDFILVEHGYRKAFGWEEDYPGSLGGQSTMNTEMVNAFKYKTLLRTPWTWSSLYPGDCLFVPAGYLHQVRSYGRSVSTTIQFSPLKSFDNAGCTLTEEEFVPLSDAAFLLAMEHGRVTLSDKHLGPSELRQMLLTLMGDGDDLAEAKFVHWFNTAAPGNTTLPDGNTLFSILTSGEGETSLTRGDLLNLPDKTLQEVADVFNLASALSVEKEEEGGGPVLSHEEL